MSVHGSVRELQLAGRSFSVAGDADVTLDLGGYQNEVQPNGNLTARIVQTAKMWSMSGVAIAIDHSQNDLQFLQEKANAGVPVAITIILTGNVAYSGYGLPTDTIQMSTQNGTAPVGFGGEGVLIKQG